MRATPFLVLTAVAALAGLVFAGVSTFDFVQHLDRQVHGITCSFIPGLDAPSLAESGCHTTLMSPYSSVFRQTIWGGLPVSLPAMAVFAFLLFRTVDLMVNRGSSERAPRTFLLAATVLPLLTSVVMGFISLKVLDAVCKLCIGIYVSSTLAFVGALLEWLKAPRGDGLGSVGEDDANPTRAFALSFGQGVGFVALPVVVYLAAMPKYDGFIGTCGELSIKEDTYGVFVDVDAAAGGAPTLEVLDPLCPACKGFEARLAASGLDPQVDRMAVLFPLDNACNWNVKEAMHPGACLVSEAVLCAGAQGKEVIDWAFANQEAIKVNAKEDIAAADPALKPEKRPMPKLKGMIDGAFPSLSACVGSDKAGQRLNQSLRWVTKNQLPVTTPQVYVDGVKLCDEDTDLGMDFALSRLLVKGAAAGGEATR